MSLNVLILKMTNILVDSAGLESNPIWPMLKPSLNRHIFHNSHVLPILFPLWCKWNTISTMVSSTNSFLMSHHFCWTRYFDLSKSKRKAWRPCCWACVCCLVVWNLLIHSLRWSKFIWIFNLLKRCVF